MSRLQTIENALFSINETVFQELCDCFLALRNSNYSAFSRTGSQTGKQKTIKGTPDTFLLLPNGKYIFVEYSTNITEGLKKLEKDINKCIDTTKTNIPVNQISEIILCLNFNLDLKEIQALKNHLINTRINLTVYTLDALALELHLNHRDLAHEYLGLPLDTGQIVSREVFVAEYNRASQGISTPLDNTFLHREKELKDLNEAIYDHDFIILTGAPGVGKTKLALEGIYNFLQENLTFQAYCVSYKNYTLFDDLHHYLDAEMDYILFVDDANRIDAFSQIIGFYRRIRKGKLKIIITVRDYALQEIKLLCQGYNPTIIDLIKLTDQQIIDIVKSKPFEILNHHYHNEIVRIADGNPRLAIMTASLANAHKNISALYDVSDLFENYFTTLVKDDGEFANPLNIKCLGLIAFFYTIPYKNREITSSILNSFEIEYSTFIDVIDKLEKLELVEIQFEHVKIPEQNLSIYFFYKAFVKDSLLSFETLLNKYFDSNRSRFRDCIIPASNTFGIDNVMTKLLPSLQNHWKIIKFKQEKALNFLSIFWFFLQTETLDFIFNIIESLSSIITLKYEVNSEKNAFAYAKDEIIELLGEFFQFSHRLKNALELSFEYVKKTPNHLPELIHKILQELTFDVKDQTDYGFSRQKILFDILLDGLNKNDVVFTQTFYELSKTFLAFKFHHTKGGRNHSVQMYDFPIPNSQPIQNLRQQIWNTIDLNFEKNPDESLNLLKSYSKVERLSVTKEIMEFDMPFLINIIEKHLNKNNFEDCKYVQNQIAWCKRNSVLHPSFAKLINEFTNPIYEIFLKIEWDRLRDKQLHDFKDYREYEKLKEEEIRGSFVFENENDFKEFYKVFTYLKKIASNDWSYNTTLDLVIDENFSRSFELGCFILTEIIKNNNDVNYIPRAAFRNHLNSKEKVNRIGTIINDHQFIHKGLWALSFYDYIDDSLLTEDYAMLAVETVNSITESNIIHFDRLQRFLKVKPDLFQTILQIIVEKNEKNGTRLQVWMDLFDDHFEQLGDDIELIKKAYLQQYKFQHYFDYEGKGFLNILKKDLNFLFEYVKSLDAEIHFKYSSEIKNLSFIWKVENIETVLRDVFSYIIKEGAYFGIAEHYCNSFFKDIEVENKERAKQFLLDYLKTNYSNIERVNVIVDIARNSMKEIFDEILLLFLSLNQDRNTFSKIYWRGNGTSGSGNIILSDLEMADWKNILSVLEKSDIGIKLIPIKKYLNEQIEYCLKSGDAERLWRFLER